MSEHNPDLKVGGTPDFLDPTPLGTLAGDWKDDDGQALDDYFEFQDSSPIVKDKVVSDVPRIPLVTRTLHNTLVLAGGTGISFMLFPPDPRRKLLTLSMGGSDYQIYWSSRQFSWNVLNSPGTFPGDAPLIPAGLLGSSAAFVSTFVIPSHTGAVFVSCGVNGGFISGTSVTE